MKFLRFLRGNLFLTLSLSLLMVIDILFVSSVWALISLVVFTSIILNDKFFKYKKLLDKINFLGNQLTLDNLETRKRELEFSNFFKKTPNLLCIANKDGFLTRISGSWTKVLGWSEEELKSRKFIEFVHPEDIEMTQEQMSQNTEQTFINRYECKNGKYISLEWNTIFSDGYYYAVANLLDHKCNKK